MVRVQVGQKQSTDRPEGHSRLSEANGRTAPAIEEQPLPTRLHQRACTELPQTHWRAHAGSEQCDPNDIGRHSLGLATLYGHSLRRYRGERTSVCNKQCDARHDEHSD